MELYIPETVRALSKLINIDEEELKDKFYTILNEKIRMEDLIEEEKEEEELISDEENEEEIEE